jgi:23S rRNA (cytosine1962-C5)-methyltransferase
MPLLRTSTTKATLRLARDLTRSLKRGHPWVFADALRDLPTAVPGTQALLLDHTRGRPVAVGYYDPASAVAFRACRIEEPYRLNNEWAEGRLRQAVEWRQRLFDKPTTGYRLFNGEGDGLPGLVCDRYADVAVIKLDGPAASAFWDIGEIADWLLENVGVTSVVERRKQRGAEGHWLRGTERDKVVEFLEHGVTFTADVINGQKTGFFLDQRENRQTMRQLCSGQRVLNVFSYTGGFSVMAGVGGARHVTSIDSAEAAIAAANANWLLNDLPADQHQGAAADAFEFLDEARLKRRKWDVVIIDPPAFAPSQATVSRALTAYRKLAFNGAAATERGGLLALASCSSHVNETDFLQTCEEGISEARRRATVLAIHSQPADHPTPLAMPEFRYLKFVLTRIE